MGRDAAVERRGVSHPNVVCPPAVGEGHSKSPREQVLLPEDGELVVSASRGDCKAGKAGTQSRQAVCPAVVPGAVTAQPSHTIREGKKKEPQEGKKNLRRDQDSVYLVLFLASYALGKKGRGTCLTVKKQLNLFPAFTNFLQQKKAGFCMDKLQA